MNDNTFGFKSLEELYNRLKPALYSKCEEIRRCNKNYIKEEDIWNYLSSKVWKNRENLNLFDMVNDILYLSIDEINDYVLDILRKNNRDIKAKENDLL
ncbi:MAG: post-transcriptional regulator [Bacilli bacterium]